MHHGPHAITWLRPGLALTLYVDDRRASWIVNGRAFTARRGQA